MYGCNYLWLRRACVNRVAFKGFHGNGGWPAPVLIVLFEGGQRRAKNLSWPCLWDRQMQQFQVSRRDLLIKPELNQAGREETINCLGRKLVFSLKANGRPAGRDQNKGETDENGSFRLFTSAPCGSSHLGAVITLLRGPAFVLAALWFCGFIYAQLLTPSLKHLKWITVT